MGDYLAEAVQLYLDGFMPLPLKPDGTKAPAVRSWSAWQRQRPELDELEDIFAVDHDGIGVLTGTVSGGLELFELEGRAVAEGLLNQLQQAMAEAGLDELWQQVSTGWVELTPSGGIHYHYRVGDGPAARNTKLARRPATPAELAENPRERLKVLVETRGEGGFTVLAPSAGRSHPTGAAWRTLAGSASTIPTITVEQRDALYAIAQQLDRYPTEAPQLPAGGTSTRPGDDAGGRPGDDLNDKMDWADILTPHGWQIARRFGSSRLGWTRPGKHVRDGISATTGGAADGVDRLYVFSSSAAPFEPETPYTKFAAWALLNTGGDYAEAARELRRAGYGAPRDPADQLAGLVDPDAPRTPAEPRWGDAKPQPALPIEPPKPKPRASLDDVPKMTLEEAHAVFRRWLGDSYDTGSLDAVLATAAVERFGADGGDPLWLLVISGPGNAKTETVQSLAGCGAMVASTLTGEAALLSATSRRERARDATGGLLRELGEAGLLVLKDVTSILGMNRDRRAEVLGALREIYDGRWTRSVGADGGRTLEWSGRIALVGAVTTAWDQAHTVISAMGDRFVLVRTDSNTGRMESARQARQNTGQEQQMRAELVAAVAGVIAGMSDDQVDITDAEAETLDAAADLVTLARTAVERDYRGDVIDAHAPESPTRFTKQLTQLVRGGVAIGMSKQEALDLAIRCARDSMPPLRLAIINDLAEHPDSSPTDVRKRLDKPRATVDRELQALHMLGLLDLDEIDMSYGETGRTRWLYRLAEKVNPAVLVCQICPTNPPRPNEERVDEEGPALSASLDILGTAV